MTWRKRSTRRRHANGRPRHRWTPAAAACLLLLLPATSQAQISELLEALLGGSSAERLTVEEVAPRTGTTIVLRLTLPGEESAAGLAATARPLDLRMRELPGFTHQVQPVAELPNAVELTLRYHGAEAVNTSFVELRVERDGAVLARSLKPLPWRWQGSGDDAIDAGDGFQEGSATEPAAHTPREIVLQPVPLADTPPVTVADQPTRHPVLVPATASGTLILQPVSPKKIDPAPPVRRRRPDPPR